MPETDRRFAADMPKRCLIPFVLLVFLYIPPLEARKTSSFCAFCSLPSLDSAMRGVVRSNKIAAMHDTDSRSSQAGLFMAAPGKSDDIARNERNDEIRLKIAQLKSQGKLLKNGEDAAMVEAEAFFNKPSPAKKFQDRIAERKRLAQLEAEEIEQLRDDGGIE